MKQAGFTYTSSVSDMVTADFVPDGKDKEEDELVGLKQQQRDPAGDSCPAAQIPNAPHTTVKPSLASPSAWNQLAGPGLVIVIL